MKVRGKKAARPTREISLACGEKITVSAPPLGVLERAARIVPPPSPPQKRVTSKAGVQFIPDEHDPEFKARERRASYLQTIYLAWEVLRTSADVEFEARLADGEEPDRSFVEKLASEIEASAITYGDVAQIAKFVGETAGVTAEEAEDALGFSDAAD